MSDEATETRLRELELTAAKAETALALSKWLIGGLCGAFAVIIVSMGYIFFHKRVDELVSDSADTYLKNIFGVNLGQFIKKINDVDEAIKHTEGFVFIGQVQSFPSGPNDCQSFGEPGTTVCLASCPDAEHWVLLSGECGIRGKGDGGTGYLQNIGTRNDKEGPTSDKPSWSCTWQPTNGSWAHKGFTIATAYCARKNSLDVSGANPLK